MKTTTKIKYLEKARDLISDKDNWCQHHAALNEVGFHTDSRAIDAVKWCATGAIDKVRHYNTQYNDVYNILSDELSKNLPALYESIEDLNDDDGTSHAHRRVIGVFNRTIKRLKKEQR